MASTLAPGARRSRWVTALGAGATLVAAAAPYVGVGTEMALADTATFYQGWGVDLGAASLLPTLLLAGAAWCLPPGSARSARKVLDRLMLGLLPTAVALVHLLPRPEPQRTVVFLYEGPRREPTVDFGPPYPMPWLTESKTLLTALGVALLVAVVFSWRAAPVRPEAALATALVLAGVAWPLAWKVHGYDAWPLILVPLAVALALALRGAHAAPAAGEGGPHTIRGLGGLA